MTIQIQEKKETDKNEKRENNSSCNEILLCPIFSNYSNIEEFF